MPEGDTLYRTAAGLRKALLGRKISGFETSETILAEIDRRVPVKGRTVCAIQPIGKNLILVLRPDPVPESGPLAEAVPTPATWQVDLIRGDLVLHTHLRMTGSWHIYRPQEAWQKPATYAKVVIRTDDFVAPCFSAPTVELLTAREAVRHPMLTSRGPDAITEEFDSAAALVRMRRHNELPAGVVLMDQRVLAGIGNVFKSEVLFIRRISPFEPVGRLDDGRLGALIAESHDLLTLNRTRGERQTRFTLNSRERLWVYGRSGEPCFTCGTKIKMRRQGLDGRSTYYCSLCQQVTL